MSPATTMEAAFTVGPSAAVRSVPAAKAAVTMEPTFAVEALVPAESTITTRSAFPMKSAAIAESVFTPVPASVPIATVEALPTSIEPTFTVVAVEPRTRANKRSADKIIRTVVSIWRARVGGIVIVAVSADRRRSDVTWPNSDPDAKPNLRAGRPRHSHAKSEQNTIL
jgi:hypothetical protein